MSLSLRGLHEDQLEVAWAEVAALRADAAQKEQQLEAAREEAAQQLAGARQETDDLKQEMRRLHRTLTRVCAMMPPHGCQEALPLLRQVLQQLDHTAGPHHPPLPSPFLLLPDGPLSSVVAKAGVRLRQVCTNLRDISPPLTALQPRLYRGVNSEQLLAALHAPARLQHVTNLDLSKAPSDIFDDSTLAHVATCCRKLRKLDMSRGAMAIGGIAALTSLAGTLQELDLRGIAVPGAHEVNALAQLTLLQRLAVALQDINDQPQDISPLTSLQLLTRVALHPVEEGFLSAADVLPTLASLPLLVDLSLAEPTVWDEESAALLHCMVMLTALGVGLAGDDSEMDAFLVQGLAALTGLREVGLLQLGKHGFAALGSGLADLPLQVLHVEAVLEGAFEVGSDLLGACTAAAEHLTRLVLASAPNYNEPILAAEFFKVALPMMGKLRVLQLYDVDVPYDLFGLLADNGRSLRSLSVHGCVAWPDQVVSHDSESEAAPSVPHSGLSRLTQLCSLTCNNCVLDGGLDGGRDALRAVGCLTNLTELELWGAAVGPGDLWRLLPLRRLQRLLLPQGSSEGAAALGGLAALERVEYGEGGVCWSGCDIRREVATSGDAAADDDDDDDDADATAALLLLGQP